MSTMVMIKPQTLHSYHPRIPIKATPISLSSTPPTLSFLKTSPPAYNKRTVGDLKWHTLKANHDHLGQQQQEETKVNNNSSKGVVASIGVAVAAAVAVAIISNGDDKAWALGPEGPLVEEFWENVRRYGLYALTVSTGVLYAVLQPIFELLKNPISALLVLIIIGGSFFILSQILSAMVGVSDFSYQYTY